MDQTTISILLALQGGAIAIGEGALNEFGREIYNSYKRKLQPIVPTIDINAVERNPNSQQIADVFLNHLSSAHQNKKEELADLARSLLAVVEQKKLAQRDSKVDLIVDRVHELFDRHLIDPLTRAEILEVSLSSLKGHGLADHLDNPKLDELAATFAVSREWLLGSVDNSSECVCPWDRSPSTAIHRLIKLTVDKRTPRLYFVKSKYMNDEEVVIQDNTKHRIAVVVEFLDKTPSGRSFKCYERWESLPWDYQRTRLDLLTLAMFCDRLSGWDDDDLSIDAKEVERKLQSLLGWVHWASCAVDPIVLTEYEKGALLPCNLVSHRVWDSWDIVRYIRFAVVSRTGGIIAKEYKYVKEQYEQVLVGFTRWSEVQKLIANAQN